MKVLALGGSVLFGHFDSKNLCRYAEIIENFEGKLIVVVGGGRIARDYISLARNAGANEALCDKIGIQVTRVNALVISSALKSSPKIIPESLEEVELLSRKYDKVVMGGTFPGHTTDATAAVVAEYLNADELLIATSVDGVYSEDPKRNPNAKRFEKITARELIEIVSRSEISAGSSSVIDLLAAKLIERGKIKTKIFLGTPENLEKALKNEKIGTEIIY